MSNMMDDNSGNWAIVELMGHKVVSGFVTKSETLGAPLLRVDVPETSAFPKFTQFYGTSAVYCVTFVSEEVACRTAEATKLNPVSVYVPDLITREQLEKTVQEYRDQIGRMRLQAPIERVDDDDLFSTSDEDDDEL